MGYCLRKRELQSCAGSRGTVSSAGLNEAARSTALQAGHAGKSLQARGEDTVAPGDRVPHRSQAGLLGTGAPVRGAGPGWAWVGLGGCSDRGPLPVLPRSLTDPSGH